METELTPRQLKIVAILAVLILLIIAFGANSYVEFMSRIFGRNALQQKAEELTVGKKSQLDKLHSIADWVNENMKYDCKTVKNYPIWPFLFFRMPNPRAEWVFYARVGGCEEHAILFQGLAEEAGIETRVVYNSGEDHTWDEVYINGSWWHFDPMRVREHRFNDPGSYERPKSFGGSGKQISYVYYLENNVPVSVTQRYTDIGHLNISVSKDDQPVTGAVVRLESHFLKDFHTDYSEPMFAIDKLTDENGMVGFELGTNNYTITVRKGQIIGFKKSIECEFFEGTKTQIIIELTSRTIVATRIELVKYIILLAFMIELAAIGTILMKKGVTHLRTTLDTL